MESRPPSKSVVLPLLGVLALGPGLIMFSFAKGEATRLASDWVYLSTPLLIIGVASFAWLLQRKLGTAGLAVGAVLGVAGLGFAMFDLNQAITERVRYRESARALEETRRFCEGKPKPTARALPFTEGGANPAVFFKSGGQSLYEKELDPFEPSAYQIEKAALVGCLMDKATTVETCNGYMGGGVVERKRVDVSLKLYSLQTGAVVFEKFVQGKAPRACANTEKFYGKSLRLTITGERPPQGELVAEFIKALQPRN